MGRQHQQHRACAVAGHVPYSDLHIFFGTCLVAPSEIPGLEVKALEAMQDLLIDSVSDLGSLPLKGWPDYGTGAEGERRLARYDAGGGRLSRLCMVMRLMGLVMLRALFTIPLRDIDIATNPRAVAKSGQDGWCQDSEPMVSSNGSANGDRGHHSNRSWYFFIAL